MTESEPTSADEVQHSASATSADTGDGQWRDTMEVAIGDFARIRSNIRRLGAQIYSSAPITVTTPNGHRVAGYKVTYGPKP